MDKKLVGLVTLFFLAFLFFLSVIVFNKPLSNLIRAREETAPSNLNSLLFAWPLDSKADGASEIKIDVFVRSETDKLVPNKEVKVSSTLGDIEPTSVVSDKNGKASFTLVSSTPGTAELSATVDAIQLSKKLTVKFE